MSNLPANSFTASALNAAGNKPNWSKTRNCQTYQANGNGSRWKRSPHLTVTRLAVDLSVQTLERKIMCQLEYLSFEDRTFKQAQSQAISFMSQNQKQTNLKEAWLDRAMWC